MVESPDLGVPLRFREDKSKVTATTSRKVRSKPLRLPLTAVRVELLSMALFDLRYSLRRSLRLLEANPHQTPQEKFEIGEARARLTACAEMHREVAEMERVLKE